MSKWVVSDSNTHTTLHHQDSKLSQKEKEEWSKGKGMSVLKWLKIYAALCFSLTDLKEMFSKATSRLLLTQASWFKIQFWTVSFPEKLRHPCSPTLNDIPSLLQHIFITLLIACLIAFRAYPLCAGSCFGALEESSWLSFWTESWVCMGEFCVSLVFLLSCFCSAQALYCLPFAHVLGLVLFETVMCFWWY